MKPIQINLVKQSLIWSKIGVAFMLIVAVTTFGVSAATIYEYYENNAVIKSYETRIQETNRRFKDKNKAVPLSAIDIQKQKQLKTTLDHLSTYLERAMRSVPLILNEIEILKPEKVDINSLVFTDDLLGLTIKGESKFVNDVSKFVIDMNRSNRFDVEITSQSFDDEQKISFELTAKWIDKKDDQKI